MAHHSKLGMPGRSGGICEFHALVFVLGPLPWSDAHKPPPVRCYMNNLGSEAIAFVRVSLIIDHSSSVVVSISSRQLHE